MGQLHGKLHSSTTATFPFSQESTEINIWNNSEKASITADGGKVVMPMRSDRGVHQISAIFCVKACFNAVYGN
jgi:hypothetical protein